MNLMEIHKWIHWITALRVVNHETAVESHWPHRYTPGLSEKDFTLGNVEQFSLSNPIKNIFHLLLQNREINIQGDRGALTPPFIAFVLDGFPSLLCGTAGQNCQRWDGKQVDCSNIDYQNIVSKQQGHPVLQDNQVNHP